MFTALRDGHLPREKIGVNRVVKTQPNRDYMVQLRPGRAGVSYGNILQTIPVAGWCSQLGVIFESDM